MLFFDIGAVDQNVDKAQQLIGSLGATRGSGVDKLLVHIAGVAPDGLFRMGRLGSAGELQQATLVFGLHRFTA